MVIDKSIPKATAKRLSLYYRIFKRFYADQIEKASSKQIADAMGIDSATVRRDFSYFGELGRRGFGYDVSKLMNFFADLLNDHSTTNVLIVGCGNIGRALLHYRFHDRNKMQISMGFDVDNHPMVGTTTADGIPIYGMSTLKEHVEKTDIETAILTVPSVQAQEVADQLIAAGIKGILSFSPVHLQVPADVIVQYVDLTSELQTLLYFMNQANK
ncbi:redox-sensing transcriptional repressor Rex [Streptococcus pseudoporcinus]|uniref:Redox-sensing transcriptional repressor Rex n=2 Tax=Streptococcus pseudoporcinus TaxID=361101 RepID=A0A4V6KZU8_9STRE|nr:redox-sensing transcriptional repressor Rex [Streptococcus pseudoporcinus]EFR45293.1 CoA binding domain protein [Streptococcus pseudoporcinus SPIN 20026]EHI65147.1 DNA-binding protein N-terminal domain protein [Streptococcus pseudoporcinus LQ 940-04]VEF92902.1 redox-sensing transcriptional repressor Rex [Streptococcus pseudoporcinus]VTS14237.1 redox-sensing transcriptional repressor Rex [Streptococcus pseudoporcinus]VTS26383.1 redox-sensing transcriptional repressor Rex [Streptococcus pseud